MGAFITSWCCSSACSRPVPFTIVYAYDDNTALQAALAASLLSSTPLEQQQQQQQQSCRAARCAGGSDGCCIFRYLGRLMMIPIFMMSFCCPLCPFISGACLFSSFRSS